MSRQSLNSFRPPSILCAFHTNQTISQFCNSQQCMLPLCKTCVPIHHKQHKTMASIPSLVEIDFLMQKINKQILYQKQDISKKHSSIVFPQQFKKKFYKLSFDIHQDGVKKIHQSRQRTIEQINKKYEAILSQMNNLYQQKIVELRTIQVKLQVLESTLDLVKGTFSKNKPMRTVILWESNGLSSLGSQLLFQIDEKIKNDQNHQLFSNKYYLDSLSVLKPNLKKQTHEIEIKTLNKYLSILGTIIEMEIDTRNSNDIKKSFMKLRTSGISLTQVSLMKSQTKKSNASQIMSTPQKTDHVSRLKELGREIKSGRTVTKQ